jgi:hypothetical protein
LVFGAQKALGNFTQKANEHLINAIMRQADGLKEMNIKRDFMKLLFATYLKNFRGALLRLRNCRRNLVESASAGIRMTYVITQ